MDASAGSYAANATNAFAAAAPWPFVIDAKRREMNGVKATDAKVNRFGSADTLAVPNQGDSPTSVMKRGAEWTATYNSTMTCLAFAASSCLRTSTA